MTYVLFCPCGHRIARHGNGGCTGSEKTGCPCRLDSAEAVYKAIDAPRRVEVCAPILDQLGKR